MSDDSVRAALRSKAPLVVVEAPAGCGKTHQGADYARELAAVGDRRRTLILTHTHAACSVFAERTTGSRSRVEIRTIDSLVGQIAGAYHQGLGLPADTASWARRNSSIGYQELTAKVARLLDRYPMISATIARRYPVVICDEHQDSSGDQHAAILALLRQGSLLRVFADPVQRIFRGRVAGRAASYDWDEFVACADRFERLDHPHRWNDGCDKLGRWTLAARDALRSGVPIDLRQGVPPSVQLVYADNVAQSARGYQLPPEARRPLDQFVQGSESLLILTRYNATAVALRAFFNRRIALWEGHTRDALERLVDKMDGTNDATLLAPAVAEFIAATGKGFSPSSFGNAFEQEVREGCRKLRKGKPALIQSLARALIDDPTHRGVAKVLRRVLELKETESAFADIEVDCATEFREAIRLAEFAEPQEGLAEITRRRSFRYPMPPRQAISTVHKAKGLDCESVLVAPCDGNTFPSKHDTRCLLYVALSRARKRLMLVLSRSNPSPLFSQ